MAAPSGGGVRLVLLTAAAAAAATPVPPPWAARAAGGQLVYSALPVQGPLPNLGNGYMAAQLGAPHLYVAGVMTGPLPPPFGPELHGDVSHRAGLPYLTLVGRKQR